MQSLSFPNHRSPDCTGPLMGTMHPVLLHLSASSSLWSFFLTYFDPRIGTSATPCLSAFTSWGRVPVLGGLECSSRCPHLLTELCILRACGPCGLPTVPPSNLPLFSTNTSCSSSLPVGPHGPGGGGGGEKRAEPGERKRHRVGPRERMKAFPDTMGTIKNPGQDFSAHCSSYLEW